jgi:trans-2,3-dihydro-3-hydroxyanthranilate isomerase
MTRFQFTQLDVFTNQSFAGNPLAVFPEAEGLNDEQMQQIAREMNLSETVFVLPPNDARALRRLRIFTPGRELPMAGHPVVGTWNALAREGVVPLPEGGSGWTRIEQELGIGVLPVDIEFSEGLPVRVVMTQGKFEILREVEDVSIRAQIEGALGLEPHELDRSLPVQVVSTGNPFLMVPVLSLDALKNCRANNSLFREVSLQIGSSAYYAFTRETMDGGSSRAHARLFAPEFGITEDPATGSAAGPLGAYLLHHGGLSLDAVDGPHKFIIEQGDFIKRPSRIEIEITGGPGAIERVRVGGPSVVVAHGELVY